MTRPLVRSMLNTGRSDRAGGSLVLFRSSVLVIRGKGPSQAGPSASAPLTPSLIGCSTQHVHCFQTSAAIVNHGLNAHTASAVPFNLLFPHS
jgi:hypothetical protein